MTFSGNPHPVPTHSFQAVVLEPGVDTGVLNSFRNRMERFSLKARNNFAIGCRMNVVTSESSSAGQRNWLGTNIPGKACSGDLSKHFLLFFLIIKEVFVWGNMLTIFNPDSTH